MAWEQSLNSWETETFKCYQNDIYYTSSSDVGGSFFPATAEIDRIATTQARVSLALDAAGNPAVAWVDTRDSKKDVYFARSLDGGQLFTQGIRIDNSPAPQERPKLVFDSSDNPVIAWIKTHHYEMNMNPVGHVYVTKSIDGGATFLPSVSVSGSANPSPYLGWPSIVLDSNDNPMIVLHYYSKSRECWNAYFVKSIDHGLSFEKPVLLERNPYDQFVPGDHVMVVDSDDNPYVAMTDNRSGNYRVRLARSVDGGMSFLPSIAVDDYSTRQITPSVAIDENDILYVAWADKRTGGMNIRFAISTDRGETFAPSIAVHENSALQIRPSLAVDSNLGVVHVTWSDSRQGRFFAYYSKSVDGGQSFTPSIPVYPFPSIE